MRRSSEAAEDAGLEDGMGQTAQRVCRKCLLREMEEGEYFKNMYDYIERLPEDDKVPDEIYEKRLDVCKTCNNLLNGMCRLCGCYVEMRAVMKIRSCPGTPPAWTSYQ